MELIDAVGTKTYCSILLTLSEGFLQVHVCQSSLRQATWCDENEKSMYGNSVADKLRICRLYNKKKGYKLPCGSKTIGWFATSHFRFDDIQTPAHIAVTGSIHGYMPTLFS